MLGCGRLWPAGPEAEERLARAEDGQGLDRGDRDHRGENHNCALLTNHTVRCWGDDELGQLGDAAKLNSWQPRLVRGLTKVLDVSAGGSHTCALLSDHRVMCWGYGVFGQLGDGQMTSSDVPVEVRST